MRKILQTAAIVLLVLLTVLAGVSVQLYRHGRNQYNTSFADTVTDTKGKDALRDASDVLRNLQIYTANYVLTGRTDSLKAARESLQDWQYESGTLELLAAGKGRAGMVRDFARTGNHLATEMDAIVSLYDAGSHDAALNRLRTGAAIADRDKLERIQDAVEKLFGRVSANRFYDNRVLAHRLIYCAGGLYVLGFLGCGMLLYGLRTTAGKGRGTRSDTVMDAASG